MVKRSRCLIAVVAWATGLVAYITALRIAWGQAISLGDLVGVIQLSAIAWTCAFIFLYVPILRRLSELLPASLRIWFLPVAALPLGLIAVAFVWLAFGVLAAVSGFGFSSFSTSFFTSPEASLFYWFFGASSIVVGLAFARFQPRKTI